MTSQKQETEQKEQHEKLDQIHTQENPTATQKPKLMEIDLETYSDVDLGKSGVYRYVEGDFHILLFSYCFDDDDVVCVDMAQGEPLPEKVLDALEDSDITKIAWNASFERTCLSHYLGHRLDPRQWKCAMVWAASLSLPLSLAAAGMVLKTGEQKDRAGKDLIRYFSVPCKPTKSNGGRTRNLPADAPEKWEQYKSYNLQDVRTERDIRKRLEAFPMPDSEWEAYWTDQFINDLGVMIDMDLVHSAIAIDHELSEQMNARAKEITGLENPNSVSQLRKWLDDRGIFMPSLGRKDVEGAIADLERNSLDTEALEMLKLRLQMSKSSVKKYEAAERCVCADGRAHGLFQFNGANRTGRFSGRLLQLQNLKRNDLDTLDEARELVKTRNLDALKMIYGADAVTDILSQLVRTMLVPKPGCEFIVADFSAIEARVLAWEAGEQWTLDAFRRGDDLYCAVASSMFGVPVVKHGINGELRQKGKIATLACGYQGGVGALKSMGALEMGLTEDELPEIIQNWRSANPHVVQYWWDIQQAAIDTIKDHRERTVQKLTFQYYAGTLWMVLPSGRKLAYLKPRLQPNENGYMSITFEGNSSTASETTGKWARQESYGGKLVENATQGISRDLLVEAMKRLTRRGFHIVAHIHDECVVEVPIEEHHTVEEIAGIMSENPSWCPDLPLSAAGYKCLTYRKD